MTKFLTFITTSLLCTSSLYAQLPAIASDVITGATSSDPYAITSAGSRLFFQAKDGVKRVYEYTSGGSNPIVSSLLADCDNRGKMSFFNGKLYFQSFVSISAGMNIFSYNPTGSLVATVVDSVSTCYAEAVELGGKLYFFGKSLNSLKYGMYAIDATGAVSLTSYVNGSVYDIVSTQEITTMGGKIYFVGSTSSASASFLYSFDPATNTYAKVVNPVGGNGTVRSLFAGDDNKLYYTEMTASLGRELFSYAGSGTPAQLTSLNGSADGINDPYNYAANPGYGQNVMKWGSKIYFSGCDGTHGYELMCYDLTSSSFSLVKDINANSSSSNPGSFIVYGSRLYFSADNGTSGRELWLTDGTDAGTMMVAETNAGAAGSNPWFMVIHSDGAMYFSADNGTSGTELFKLANPVGISKVGTVQNIDVYPNPAQSNCTLAIALSDAQAISVDIIDNSGRSVISVTSAVKQLRHEVNINFAALASGVYNYRVTTPGGSLLAAGKIVH